MSSDSGKLASSLSSEVPPTREQCTAALGVLYSAARDYRGSAKDHEVIQASANTLQRHLSVAQFVPPADPTATEVPAPTS